MIVLQILTLQPIYSFRIIYPSQLDKITYFIKKFANVFDFFLFLQKYKSDIKVLISNFLTEINSLKINASYGYLQLKSHSYIQKIS